MRRKQLVGLIAIVIGLTGCGGNHDSESVSVRTAGKRLISVQVSGIPGRPVRAVAQPQVGRRELPLAAVATLIPRHLPEPSGVVGSCDDRPVVQVEVTGGERVTYRQCEMPLTIRWLEQAIIGEQTNWSSPPAHGLRIVGGTPVERRALVRLVHQLGPTRIRSIWITSLGDSNGYRLPDTDLVLKAQAGTSMRGQWEVGLLAREYNAEAGRLRIAKIGVVKSNGGSGPIDTSLDRPAAIPVALVRKFAASSGAAVVEARQQGSGFALVLRVPHVARFLLDDGRRILDLLNGRKNSYYLGIEQSDGSVVYAVMHLPGEGGFFGRPDLVSCGLIDTIGLLGGDRQPPCPA